MSGKKRIFLAALLVVIAAAIYLYNEYHRTNVNIASEAAAFGLQAEQLLSEFASDDSAANRKYVGKIISITGVVKSISRDERGFYTLNLGDTSSLSSIRCSIDTIHSGNVAAVQRGTTIKIKGNCTGYIEDELLGLDIIMNRCMIED